MEHASSSIIVSCSTSTWPEYGLATLRGANLACEAGLVHSDLEDPSKKCPPPHSRGYLSWVGGQVDSCTNWHLGEATPLPSRKWKH